MPLQKYHRGTIRRSKLHNFVVVFFIYLHESAFILILYKQQQFMMLHVSLSYTVFYTHVGLFINEIFIRLSAIIISDYILEVWSDPLK